MTVLFPKEICSMCGNYLDDDLKCYECKICDGENMTDTITLTTDTTFHGHYDDVNNPKHYNRGGLECIEAIEAMLTHEEFVGYLRGNSLKYRWRFRYKNGIQDLDKAQWYENKLKEILLKKEREGK